MDDISEYLKVISLQFGLKMLKSCATSLFVHIPRLIDYLKGGLALKGASGEAAFDVRTSCLLTSEASAEAKPGSLRGHSRSRQAGRGAASETDV